MKTVRAWTLAPVAALLYLFGMHVGGDVLNTVLVAMVQVSTVAIAVGMIVALLRAMTHTSGKREIDLPWLAAFILLGAILWLLVSHLITSDGTTFGVIDVEHTRWVGHFRALPITAVLVYGWWLFRSRRRRPARESQSSD